MSQYIQDNPYILTPDPYESLSGSLFLYLNEEPGIKKQILTAAPQKVPLLNADSCCVCFSLCATVPNLCLLTTILKLTAGEAFLIYYKTKDLCAKDCIVLFPMAGQE